MEYLDRAAIKAEAKQLIRTGQRSVLGMSAIYFLISFVLSGVEFLFSRFSGEKSLAYGFVTVLVSLFSSVLSAGFVFFCMAIRRGEAAPFSMLFDGFGMAGKVIVLTIWMGLRVFLWSMLFVIPGIVAMYRYRFALYNLLENPDLTANQAIALSKIQTEGMKGQLFVLDLSYIGWYFLMLAVGVPLAYWAILTGGLSFATLLCGLVTSLLGIYLSPYMQLADLGYYEAGKRIISPYPGADGPYPGGGL